MEHRVLGREGPEVPIICIGTWGLSGSYGAVPERQAVATIHAALDAGITFIDTAEGYGSSESLVGKAIEGRRHEAVIGTKLSGDHSPEQIDQAIENSLTALGTDYVDLYQLHHWSPEWPIQQTMEHLRRLQDSGKIRYIGVSNFTADQTKDALKFGPIHSSQPRYSMLFRGSGESILPFCQKHGIGVLPFSVLAKGLLTGRYEPNHQFAEDDQRSKLGTFTGEKLTRTVEVAERLKVWAGDHGRDLLQLAIAWVLANSAVTSAIVGARSPGQVEHIARAADWGLSSADLKEIDGIQGDLRLYDMEWSDGRPDRGWIV